MSTMSLVVCAPPARNRKRRGTFVAPLLFAGLLLVGSRSAAAQEPAHHAKMDVEVETAVHQNRPATRVIVQFTDATSRENGRRVAGAYGAVVSRDLNSLTALSLRGSASSLDALALDPGVAHVSLDAAISASDLAVQQSGEHADQAGGASEARRQSGAA